MPKLIDLSHPLIQGQMTFPSDPQLSIAVHNTVAKAGYNITQISMSTHQGTHLDAPFHFYDDGKTLDQMPLEHFMGPTTLIDLAPGSALPAKTPITVEMLSRHEAVFREGTRVIYRTGWDRMFGKPEFFTDFPTLTIDAAHWIAQRKIRLLGMDTPTPSTEWLQVHLILLERGVEIVIVESLTNLERLPGKFTFVGFPMNIKGRDGSPIRAVAVVE